MGALLDRLVEIQQRCNNLAPLASPVITVLRTGNRDRALAGTDAAGTSYAPLAPATLKRRKGTGPPQAPQGEASRIVTAQTWESDASPGELRLTGSWPSLAWLIYHVQGTSRMPARDPVGFRPQDIKTAKTLLREYVGKD